MVEADPEVAVEAVAVEEYKTLIFKLDYDKKDLIPVGYALKSQWL